MQDVDRWLQEAGIEFNPFLHLESSQDRHLLKFLLLHEGLEAVWEDVSALILAPVGGGKTALRHYATWASWRGNYAFFPVPYVLPHHWDRLPPEPFHLQTFALAGAIAKSIFFYSITLPQRLLELDHRTRKNIYKFIWQYYTETPLLIEQWIKYNTIEQEGNNWYKIINQIAEPAQIGAYAKPPTRHLKSLQEELIANKSTLIRDRDEILIEEMIRILQDAYHFSAIHFLVDGADAFPDSPMSNGVHRDWLQMWLTDFVAAIGKKNRIKLFLPSAMIPEMVDLPQITAVGMKVTTFSWDPLLLAEVVRRRLYIASGGRFDSLDALSDSSILNLEMLLAQRVQPLPREILALTQRIFVEHVHARPRDPLLRGEDIDAALEWYESTVPHR